MRIAILSLALISLIFLGTSCNKGPEYRTDATVKDIMDSIVDPNADFIWQSVSSKATLKGVIEKAPQTDEDWKELRRHAVALREAMNLLLVPGRAVARPGEKADDPRVEEQPEEIQSMIRRDPNAWTKMAHGLYDAAALVLKAVDAKNIDMIQDADDQIDKACETCHLKYWYPKQYDLLQKDRPNTSEKSR